MEKIEIFGRHTSYNVQKVLWLLEELAIVYSHTPVGGRFGGNDTAEFLAMNPQGKVPVLKHNDKIIRESNTIVRYLADVFSGGAWISPRAYQRSLAEQWMDWSIEKFEPAFVGVFWGYYRTPVEARNNDEIAASVVKCEACMAVLATALADKPFLTGKQASVADIATGVFLYRLDAIDLPVAMPPEVLAWYQRLSDMKGYQRWVMSDFTELRGRSSY